MMKNSTIYLVYISLLRKQTKISTYIQSILFHTYSELFDDTADVKASSFAADRQLLFFFNNNNNKQTKMRIIQSSEYFFKIKSTLNA